MSKLEQHFALFRRNVVGFNQRFQTPYGRKKLIYADWTASGRLYGPLEEKMLKTFGPFVGNTHSESNLTGSTMTAAYQTARQIIKNYVNAGEKDVILASGYGMTSAVNKLQRILGLKVPEKLLPYFNYEPAKKPVVFITHMEHHSNQTSWLETIADVVCIRPDDHSLVDLNHLQELLTQYQNRPLIIGAFTACSNVTGIQPPYRQMARIIHEYGGICFIDFAASAPYVNINMHPASLSEKLDGIYFSPHKFLGGPGTCGILIFDSELYSNKIPDQPGGGTVAWTNPWGKHQFLSDIETREDGGTPGFLQVIKTALCFELKEHMNIQIMQAREKEQLAILFAGLSKVPGLRILAGDIIDRLGIVSFYVEGIHYNLMVKILNDRYGIQTRGGCSCAGTYGHYLLQVDRKRSRRITEKISNGDLSEKPGWVRVSIHPLMTDQEIIFIIEAIKETVQNIGKWREDYLYNPATNEFINLSAKHEDYYDWFHL